MKKLKARIFVVSLIFCLLIGLFLPLRIALADPPEQQILFSQTDGTITNALTSLYPGSGNQAAVGQTVNDTDTLVKWNITDVSFPLRRQNSPTGNSTCRIWNATSWPTGGKPTGSQIAQSNNVDVSTFSLAPTWTWVNYSFSGGVLINSLQAIAIANVAPTAGIMNSTFNYETQYNSSDVNDGNWFGYFGSWLDAGYDQNIIVYGYLVGETLPNVEQDLSDFTYRREINLFGMNGSGVNYQVKFVVHNGTGTETNNNIWLNNRTRADFGDVRYSDGNVMIPYWLETNTLYSGHNATFWVKVTSNLDVNQSIYIYYGNATATTTSNGPATFQLFDDFNDATINSSLWGVSGSAIEANGILTVSAAYIGHYSYVHSAVSYPVGMAMEYSARIPVDTWISTVNFGVSSYWPGIPYSGIYFTAAFRSQTGQYNFSYISATGLLSGDYPQYAIVKTTAWERCSLRRTGSNDTLVMGSETHKGNYPTAADRYVNFLIVASSSYSVNASVDWAAVRKYVEPLEPYMSSIGAEEYDTHSFWIDNMEGCGNWLFTEMRNYNFRLNVSSISLVSTVFVSFIDGASHNVTLYWNNVTQLGGVYNGSDYARFPTGGVTATYTGSFNMTILWQTFLLGTLTDKIDVDVYYAYNRSNGVWNHGIAAAAYFNLYSKGGLTTTTISGSAGRLEGQDVFDLWANNDSSVQASMIWRGLQHVKLRPEVFCKIGGSYFNVTYGVDYCTGESTWISGWRLTLSAYAVTYGSTIDFVWDVYLFRGISLIRKETVHMYHAPGAADYSNTSTIMWIDLWFNRVNASSTAGARVNAYYFSMEDAASSWLKWLTGSNWGAIEDLQKETMLFEDLHDATGNLLYTSEIKLTRFYCNLTVAHATDANSMQYVKLSKYEVFDMTFCQPPLVGIHTPTFDETKVIVMPQGGFLGYLASQLNALGVWIATAIGPGLLIFWTWFVNALDSIAAWAGFPGLFSSFFDWLGSLWAWIPTSAASLVSMLTSSFSFLMVFLPKLLHVVTDGFGYMAATLAGIFGFLGAITVSGMSTWDALGMTSWLELGMILYPVWLLILWDTSGLNAVEHELRRDWWILSSIGMVFWVVIKTFIDVLGRIIESVPVVE